MEQTGRRTYQHAVPRTASIRSALLLSYEGISPYRRDTGPTPAHRLPTASAPHAPMNSPRFPTLASPTQRPADAEADLQEQERACHRAWLLVRDGAPRLAEVPRGADPALARALREAFNAGTLPGTLIETELRRALGGGASDATLLALVLLAATALERWRGGRRALALAGECAELARRPEAAGVASDVLRAHAALVLARHAPLCDAALLQAEACRLALPRQGNAARNAVLWTGLRMLAGAPLAELLQYGDAVQQAGSGCRAGGDTPAAERQLAGRVALFRRLAGRDGNVPAPRATLVPLAATDATSHFACWLTRLQSAYLHGNTAGARSALEAAAALVTPLVPPCELLPYHLFAALTLAQPDGPPALRGRLRVHRRTLQAWARRAPEHAGALAELARAAEQDAAGSARALATCEQAAALAQGAQQAWVAALAWERAAALCARLEMHAALPAYRRLALDAWRDWGAHGRVRELMQAWDDGAPPRPAGQPEPGGENRAARAGTVGELGITIAHEVNQPLAAILLHAAAARRWLRRGQPDAGRALEALEQITACGRQASDIVRSVRALARRQGEDASTFAIDPALAEVVQLLRALMQRQGVQLETRLLLPDRQLRASRAQLQQIMMNLLLNAIEALAAVTGRARRIVLESGAPDIGHVELRVIDNGPGICPGDRERIFEALYSTKPHGTGIGLSISRSIAEAHGGRIDFVPVEPHGAMFRVLLPVRSPSDLPQLTGTSS
jgi:signal transduction histidine kinase